MKIPKDIEDTNWEEIYDAYKKMKDEESLLDTIKFEVSYFFGEIRNKYYTIKNGISNYWKYRKIIWKDRWWDHMFLHDLLKFKLQDMHDNWDKSYACNSEDIKTEIKVLIDILNLIEVKEDDVSGGIKEWDQNEKDINKLYQTFGERLFSIRAFERKKCNGEVEATYESNLFRQLWD
jgi:hypothetical protein